MKRTKNYANIAFSSEYQLIFHVFVSLAVSRYTAQWHHFFCFVFVCVCMCVCAKPPCAGGKKTKKREKHFAELLFPLLPQQLLIDS